MLTEAHCDKRRDPGDSFPLHVRVLWRLSPVHLSEDDLLDLQHTPEDLHAAQYYAGCLSY